MKRIILIVLSVFLLSACEISESNRLEPGTSNHPTIKEDEMLKNRIEEQRKKEEQLTDDIINEITITTPVIVQ
jgi:hypothetical protein